MTTKTKRKAEDLESDKALREVVKEWRRVSTEAGGGKPILEFYVGFPQKLVARLDLRKVIKLRKGLTGIRAAEKAMKKATRGRK